MNNCEAARPLPSEEAGAELPSVGARVSVGARLGTLEGSFDEWLAEAKKIDSPSLRWWGDKFEEEGWGWVSKEEGVRTYFDRWGPWPELEEYEVDSEEELCLKCDLPMGKESALVDAQGVGCVVCNKWCFALLGWQGVHGYRLGMFA